ncbi:MAG: hypothetical protein ABI586_06120 [Candidatus Nanopelagicales bacterium]
MRNLLLGLCTTALLLSGCGGGGNDETATTAPVESKSVAPLVNGKVEIVIKTYADLQSVVDIGKVLDGSSVGDLSFCPKGTFSGGHGNTDNGWLDHIFECSDGTLTIAFDPRNQKERSASGPWEVLSGTGAYQGMTGSGQMEIKFPADPQVATGHETFTGTVSQ